MAGQDQQSQTDCRSRSMIQIDGSQLVNSDKQLQDGLSTNEEVNENQGNDESVKLELTEADLITPSAMNM